MGTEGEHQTAEVQDARAVGDRLNVAEGAMARPEHVGRRLHQHQARETLVMCDQIATVDLNLLAEPAGFLTLLSKG